MSQVKLFREVIKAAKSEAALLGCSVEDCGKGSRGHLLKVTVGNVSRIIGISCTPRTGDNLVHWVRQDIRKCYRQLAG